MLGSGYFTRLAAALCAAALMGAAIQYPGAARNASGRIAAAFAAAETPYAQRACAIGEPAFDGPFAPLEDVLSVSPLGGVTAPGEILPAPYIRINTRQPDETFGRRDTDALAPARADIVALERRIERDEAGRPRAQSWTAHFRICDKISFYYDRLDRVSETLLKRAGGLEAFVELGGPDHVALETRIRVGRGDIIGVADGFDVALHDRAAPPARLERPERYSANPYARAAIFDVAASLVKTITPDTSQARCPIDYLPKDEQSAWADKLGDSWGIRRAKGDDACRTALADLPGAAQGVWYTDAAHNAATTKVSAIALSPDAIDPGRLVFALHGRLASLTPSMIGLAPFMEEERAAAARDFITAERGAPGSRAGAGRRVNAPFADIRDGEIYCYQGLRANFVGPVVNGVILLGRQSGEEGPALLKIEARGGAAACADLPDPWAFTGNETTFYR
jgi:hypothetical protein